MTETELYENVLKERVLVSGRGGEIENLFVL